MVDDSGAALFGTSPTYVSALEKGGFVPKDKFKLTTLLGVTLAGSPVTPECMEWLYNNIKKDLWVASGSGGTDVCTGFVAGASILPVYAGEIQARSLGVAAYAFNERGEKIVNKVGELVVTEPMPSMPVCFWNDTNNKRYLESYFQDYPGVWRHGDFFKINERGGCFVLVARTPLSTATASASVPRRFIARWRRCPKSTTRSSSTWTCRTAGSSCRCSSSSGGA